MANQLSTVEKEIEKILPEDVINALQSGYKVFQGEADQLDDLLKHSGVLLKKAAQRFTTTQLILGIAGVAVIAIIAAKKAADAATSDDETSYDSHKKDAAHTSAKPA
jgi:recombination associated protein RdgC